jgi:hypothetical protein
MTTEPDFIYRPCAIGICSVVCGRKGNVGTYNAISAEEDLMLLSIS